MCHHKFVNANGLIVILISALQKLYIKYQKIYRSRCIGQRSWTRMSVFIRISRYAAKQQRSHNMLLNSDVNSKFEPWTNRRSHINMNYVPTPIYPYGLRLYKMILSLNMSGAHVFDGLASAVSVISCPWSRLLRDHDPVSSCTWYRCTLPQSETNISIPWTRFIVNVLICIHIWTCAVCTANTKTQTDLYRVSHFNHLKKYASYDKNVFCKLC